VRVPKAGVDIGTEKRSPGVFVVLAVSTENGRKTRHERDGGFLLPPAREIWSEESSLESGPPGHSTGHSLANRAQMGSFQCK
jgi:hypothetical protein